MMQKALGELFILKNTKPLPIIFKTSFTLQLASSVNISKTVADTAKVTIND